MNHNSSDYLTQTLSFPHPPWHSKNTSCCLFLISNSFHTLTPYHSRWARINIIICYGKCIRVAINWLFCSVGSVNWEGSAWWCLLCIIHVMVCCTYSMWVRVTPIVYVYLEWICIVRQLGLLQWFALHLSVYNGNLPLASPDFALLVMTWYSLDDLIGQFPPLADSHCHWQASGIPVYHVPMAIDFGFKVPYYMTGWPSHCP